jgi:hypothetical protein
MKKMLKRNCSDAHPINRIAHAKKEKEESKISFQRQCNSVKGSSFLFNAAA